MRWSEYKILLVANACAVTHSPCLQSPHTKMHTVTVGTNPQVLQATKPVERSILHCEMMNSDERKQELTSRNRLIEIKENISFTKYL